MIKYFEYEPDQGSVDVYISYLDDALKSQINKMLIEGNEDELSYSFDESDTVDFDEWKVNKYYYACVGNKSKVHLGKLKELLIDNGYKMTKISWLND